MTYVPAPDRYDQIPYRRCGRSGIKLPEISLGLWQNFGSDRPLDVQRAIILRAFDLGVTHFDLANNYGGHTLGTSDDPLGRLGTGSPYGSAEQNFGRILFKDLEAVDTPDPMTAVFRFAKPIPTQLALGGQSVLRFGVWPPL